VDHLRLVFDVILMIFPVPPVGALIGPLIAALRVKSDPRIFFIRQSPYSRFASIWINQLAEAVTPICDNWGEKTIFPKVLTFGKMVFLFLDWKNYDLYIIEIII
jgi:hypothetical protein